MVLFRIELQSMDLAALFSDRKGSILPMTQFQLPNTNTLKQYIVFTHHTADQEAHEESTFALSETYYL